MNSKAQTQLVENVLQSFSTFFSEGLPLNYLDNLGNQDKKNLLVANAASSDASIYDLKKNIPLLEQMQLIFNDASIERLKNRNKEILKNIEQKIHIDLGDEMIEKVQRIEDEIIEMLKEVPVVVQDEPNNCVKPEPSTATEISRLSVPLSLIGISLLIITLYKYLPNRGQVHAADDSKIPDESQPVKSELDEKAPVIDSEQTSQSSSESPANAANHSPTETLDNSSLTAPETPKREELLEQLTLKIFTLSSSRNDDEKKDIVSLFNDKLAVHDQYSKDRELILSELQSMIHLEETPGYEESQTKEKLKTLGCEVCEILHNVLIEISQRPHSSSQEELQSSQKDIPATTEETEKSDRQTSL